MTSNPELKRSYAKSPRSPFSPMLVRQDILEQRFPEQPTHPAQAYRVKTGDKDEAEKS